MADITRVLRNLLKGHDGAGAHWAPLAAAGGLAVVLSLLFAHIFMVVILGVTAVALGIWLTERALGPGTRIRLAVPASARLWWRGLLARIGRMGPRR